MIKRLLKYSRILTIRAYHPFAPVFKPLKHPIVISCLILVALLLALTGRFYVFDPEYSLQEQAAFRPWQSQANYLKVRAEIGAWEKLNEIRPYSKDILLKLALLYAQINEVEPARDYFNKAEYLDPAISPLPFSR